MAHWSDTSLPHSLTASSGIDRARADKLAGDTQSGIVSEIHEFAVPEFAAIALDQLHGSLYASLRYLQRCNAIRPTPHTWIAYHRGEVIGVLLFRMQGLQAVVLTEMVDLSDEIVSEFCRAVFSRFAYAESVHFNAVSLSRPLSGLVRQQHAFSENYVITLPDHVDDYEAALGRSTRKTIRGYGNRLRRDYPDLRWEMRQGKEMRCDELRRLLRQLQTFKRISMASRGKRAELARRDTARMLALALESGLIGIAQINGRIVGGSLACRIGDNYVMLLSAADPSLESYRLGMLCCFWSVCDCIRVGARECHLLWGRYPYKTQLLGNLRILHRIVIYRSRLQMALSPASVIRMSWMSLRSRLRQWVLDHARNHANGFFQRAYAALQVARGSYASVRDVCGVGHGH